MCFNIVNTSKSAFQVLIILKTSINIIFCLEKMLRGWSFDRKLGLLNQKKNIHFTILWKKNQSEK